MCLTRQFLRKIWPVQLACFVCLYIATILSLSAMDAIFTDAWFYWYHNWNRFLALVSLRRINTSSCSCVTLRNMFFLTARSVSSPQKTEVEWPSAVCCPQRQMYYTRISCNQATLLISPSARWSPVEMWWHTVMHRRGNEGGNWRMQWVTSTLHTTSEHGVSRITTADAHTSAASSRLNWRTRRFKWTRSFRRKTKTAFCACVVTFQTQSIAIGSRAVPRSFSPITIWRRSMGWE